MCVFYNVRVYIYFDIHKRRNTSMRYAGYRQYTWWVHNHLGKGVRKVIASCAIWTIRDMYPEQNGYYVPYQEAKDELNA